MKIKKNRKISFLSSDAKKPLPGHFPDGGAQPPHSPYTYTMSTKEMKKCVLFTTCLFLPLKLTTQLVLFNQN